MKDTDFEYMPGGRFLVIVEIEQRETICSERFALRKPARQMVDRYNALKGITARMIDTKQNVRDNEKGKS